MMAPSFSEILWLLGHLQLLCTGFLAESFADASSNLSCNLTKTGPNDVTFQVQYQRQEIGFVLRSEPKKGPEHVCRKKRAD
eukprot:scaffold22742_cov139-Cylindrotheca_fusiformis.AAC.9